MEVTVVCASVPFATAIEMTFISSRVVPVIISATPCLNSVTLKSESAVSSVTLNSTRVTCEVVI